MGLAEETNKISNQIEKTELPSNLHSSEFSAKYQELSRPLEDEKDVLFQFKAHIQNLEDLTGRLNYTLSEVSHFFKKR